MLTSKTAWSCRYLELVRHKYKRNSGWCFPDTKLCLNTPFYFLMLFMPQKASVKNWDLLLKCWWKPENRNLQITFSLHSVLQIKSHVLMMLNGLTSFPWNTFLCVWLSSFIFMQKYNIQYIDPSQPQIKGTFSCRLRWFSHWLKPG